VTASWVLSVPHGSTRAVAELRLQPGLQVLETPEALWLRGQNLDDRLRGMLRAIPGATLFTVLPEGELQAEGSRLPHGRVPFGSWREIREWARFHLPRAFFGGHTPSVATLQLVRSQREMVPNVVLTTLAEWHRYAAVAPGVRLAPLRFAVSSTQSIVIHGQPIPFVRGDCFYEQSGIALPCGCEWSLPVEPQLIRQSLGLGTGDLALFARDGNWEWIRSAEFVRATRSAVRETLAALSGSVTVQEE
jgi:MoxR-vWA-beta-propeller ternary system domain bpX2